MRTDTDILTQQIAGTIETFDAVLDAVHAGEPYDDGSGIGQDPMTVLDQFVHEVTAFRSVRLLLSGGGPRVVAEAEIDPNGEIVRPKIIATSISDRVEQELASDSSLAAVLQLHASLLTEG